MISFQDDTPFDGFGPSSLASAYRSPTSWLPLGASNAATRRSIREGCPAMPGVYGMVGVNRELIYVGESKSLRDRLLSYFTGKPASAKVRRTVQETKWLVWERSGHEFTALLRELELIRRWQPRFNVLGNPGRSRRAFLCVGRGAAPHAYLSVKPSDRQGWTFGPVPANRSFRRSVRRLNDCFGLRDCRRSSEMLFSDQLDLFVQRRDARCVRGATGTCLAPCATACSQAEYRDRIGAAVDFLSGRDAAVLARVEEEMKAAACSRKYELAARLRDAHEDLARLAMFFARLREAHGHSFVYTARGPGGGENWYLIREGQVAAVEQRPGDSPGSVRCRKGLDAVFPRNPRTWPPAAPEDLDVVLLVGRWFREHPDELKAVLSPAEARRRCG